MIGTVAALGCLHSGLGYNRLEMMYFIFAARTEWTGLELFKVVAMDYCCLRDRYQLVSRSVSQYLRFSK